MKQVSSKRRSGRGARSSSNGPQNNLVRLSSKRSAGSSTTGETQVSSSTDQSQSRTPSPRRQNSRGMDPGGLVVIPRRQKHPLKKSSKPAATDGEERAIVAVPPSTLVPRNEKVATSKKSRKSNTAPGVNETALIVYNSNGNDKKSGVTKSKSNTVGGSGRRVKEESKDNIRQSRARPLYSAKENKQSTSSSRPNISTSRVTDEDDNNRQSSKGKSRSMSKSLRGSWKKLSDVVKDKSKNKKGEGANDTGGMSPDKPAKKKTLSKRKKNTHLNSISGSSVAIRSFSEAKGYGSWQDGEKLPGKATTSAKDLAEKKEEAESIAPTAIVVASPGVSARKNLPSRKDRGNGRQSNERTVRKQDRSSTSPPSPSRDNRNRRSSSSPQRGDFNRRSVSPESVYSRDSYYSRSRSPSPSPRRNRQSLSPQSSRSSSYSGSRSPSPRWRRRSLTPRSCASYSRSRSPSHSPRRRRSVSSERSCESTVHSFCSLSRSPSPGRTRARSISPPSARGRRIRIFRSPSRSPSPRNMRQFGGARRCVRKSPPRMNYNRRGSFRSLSPPRRKRPNGAFPMRTNNNMVPHRRPSFSSRSPSPQRRWGRKQTIARGNPQQYRRVQRPQRQLSPSPPRGVSNGTDRRRRSSSPPWNRSSSHQKRFGRRSSDIDLRAKVTSDANGNTRRRQELQRRGSLEGREMHSASRPTFHPHHRRQPTGGYQRDVSKGSMPKPAVKSEALVIRDASPPNEKLSAASMSALVSPRVESQSLLYKQTPRRLSSSSDSSGVWIDCPEQYSTDDHEEELTFIESPNLREDNSDATCDAKNGFFSTPGTTSVAHSFATYEVQSSSPSLSSRQWSKQVNSTKGHLPSVPQLDEDAITQSKKMMGTDADVSNFVAQLLSTGSGLARKSTNDSFPSDTNLGTPNMNIPGLPPRRTPVMPFAVPSVELRNNVAPNGTSSVENSRASMGSSGFAHRQSAQENDPPFISHLSPPPPPFPRSDNSQVEKLEGPTVANWQQYLTRGNRNTIKRRGSSRSTSPERGGSKEKSLSRRKLFGKAPEKLDYNDRQINNVVSDMPYRDPFGDFGIYCGQVNEEGRPNGKGSMKYDNGIFYEGMWTDGCQDEKAVTQYDRIRGGFTSWGGKGKAAVKSGMTLPWNAHRNDKIDENDTTNVRGMEWVDLNGDSGRYTGEVNREKVPHGQGIMKYSFGLIADGEWVCGVLKENPQDRMLSAADLSSRGQNADAMSVLSGGRSLGLGGGMSMGGGMSLGQRPPMLEGGLGSGMPQMMQPQQIMMQPQSLPIMLPQANNMVLQQNAGLVAQQNAMLQAGFGGPSMALHPPTPRQRLIPVQSTTQGKPPITEIKFT